MNTSDSIKAISEALIGFHKEVAKIPKDAKNPFFKSKYASLSAILDAIDAPLLNNGLVLVQFPQGENGLTSRLCHKSGEWMEETYVMKPSKDDPQGRGSALTYQRRYAIGAILSLNIDDDDDANHASGQTNGQAQQPQDDKSWLNENTKAFSEAILAVKEGKVTIAQIEKKYKLSKSVRAVLEGAAKQPQNA